MNDRAVFLEKDGTLVEDGRAGADPAKLRLLPGASQGLARLRAAGFRIFIVSHQPGVARGQFREADLTLVVRRLEELLARRTPRSRASITNASGLLAYSYWGLPDHYDPRAELEWGYGSIMGDRDINEHDFNFLYWMPSLAKISKYDPPIGAEAVVNICVNKMKPLEPDPMMLDFSADNMYSNHIARLVSWHRHYTRFWKESAMFCDLRYADFYNQFAPNNIGITGEGEPKFYHAVTGTD